MTLCFINVILGLVIHAPSRIFPPGSETGKHFGDRTGNGEDCGFRTCSGNSFSPTVHGLRLNSMVRQKNPVKFGLIRFVQTRHRFLNTLDTTHSNKCQQQTGWKHSPRFYVMLYLSTNFETRYLLSSCSNHSIDKNFYFRPNICRRLHLVYLEIDEIRLIIIYTKKTF